MDTQQPALKAPFPYMGGKSSITAQVWALLGDPDHYIEPFAGSLAVLLARPLREGERRHETCGDASARIAHVWRAIKLAPEQVAQACVWPAHEVDYHARHADLLRRLPDLRARMLADPHWCDPELAGWEVWGMSLQIGTDWLKESRLGGRCGCALKGTMRAGFDPAQIHALALRLQHVATLYGDWRRCVSSDSALRGPMIGAVQCHCIGVFLDPPYTTALNRSGTIYGTDCEADIAAQVRDWCAEMGSHPWLRIVLAGHAGEHDALIALGWRRVEWIAGGMDSGGWCAKGRTKGRDEALWASPACLSPEAAPLLVWMKDGGRQPSTA